jgi:hypothetical protein
VNALLETPLIGHPYGKRLRRFTVGDKFPYSIVYAVLGNRKDKSPAATSGEKS